MPAISLNVPSWSLFWELAVNLGFALVAPWLSNRVLGAVIAVAVAGAIGVSWVNGGLAYADMSAGFRALAGFSIGVMLLRVHRSGRFRADWLGAAAVPVLLLSLIAVPARPWVAMVYDPLVVCLLFPPILLASARREVRYPTLCIWLGGLSYPLYILQGPLRDMIRPRLLAATGSPLMTALAVAAIILIASAIAWRLYDEPVRAALRRRFVSRAPDRPDTPAF